MLGLLGLVILLTMLMVERAQSRELMELHLRTKGWLSQATLLPRRASQNRETCYRIHTPRLAKAWSRSHHCHRRILIATAAIGRTCDQGLRGRD